MNDLPAAPAHETSAHISWRKTLMYYKVGCSTIMNKAARTMSVAFLSFLFLFFCITKALFVVWRGQTIALTK